MTRLLAATCVRWAAASLGVLSAAASCGFDSGEATAEATASEKTAAVRGLVISQVFGAGGAPGALYANDFVELFNRGTSPASLDGLALQYAGGTKAFDKTRDVLALPPGVALAPGQHFLVALGGSDADGGGTGPLDADLVADPAVAITMGKDKGKIAIVGASDLLDGCGTTAGACESGRYVDFVGYGGASQAQGTHTADLTPATAAIRRGDPGGHSGCRNTNDNAADFDLAPPAPRNAAAALTPCPAASDPGPATEDAGKTKHADDAGGPEVEDAGATTKDKKQQKDDPAADLVTGAPDASLGHSIAKLRPHTGTACALGIPANQSFPSSSSAVVLVGLVAFLARRERRARRRVG